MADGMNTNDSPVITADIVPSGTMPEQPVPVAAILVAERVDTVCEVAQIAKINPAQLVATPKRSWIASFFRGLGSLIWYSPWRLFQFASLLVLLAVTSTIPVLQLASLGYMLEAGGRIAQSGRWREGLPGLGMAGRIGSFLLGATLTFLPVWFIKDFATTAQLINPGSVDAKFLETFSWILFFAWMGNLTWVFLRGAKWWHFYWPQPIRFVKEIWRPSTWQRANDNLWSAITRLQLPSLLWLGFRGGLGALCWLAIPATFMAIGLRAREEAPLLGLIGLIGAIGMTLVEHRPQRFHQIDSESIPFEHTVFHDRSGTVVHAFKGTWVSGTRTLAGDGIRGGREQWRKLRWKAAAQRFRPAHARVTQGAVRGIPNPDSAWLTFQETVLQNLSFKTTQTASR